MGLKLEDLADPETQRKTLNINDNDIQMFKTTFKLKNKIDYLKNTPKFIKELVKQINNLCFFCKNFNFDDSNSLFVIAKKAKREGKANKKIF